MGVLFFLPSVVAAACACSAADLAALEERITARVKAELLAELKHGVTRLVQHSDGEVKNMLGEDDAEEEGVVQHGWSGRVLSEKEAGRALSRWFPRPAAEALMKAELRKVGGGTWRALADAVAEQQ